MFLSSTQDALNSLLCSAFFDPSIPCNLIGAYSSGIKKAFCPSKASSPYSDLDFQRFSYAIMDLAPHLSLLWVSVICTSQAESFTRLALSRLAPLCLPAAFWTDTIQSFLQVLYLSDTLGESNICRATEFQISYYCRTETSVPWTPSPPFGLTLVDNLSLDVKEHLEHEHRPRAWRIDWILKSGLRIPASPQHKVNIHVCEIAHNTSNESCEE
jgi:hypothetical protein